MQKCVLFILSGILGKKLNFQTEEWNKHISVNISETGYFSYTQMTFFFFFTSGSQNSQLFFHSFSSNTSVFFSLREIFQRKFTTTVSSMPQTQPKRAANSPKKMSSLPAEFHPEVWLLKNTVPHSCNSEIGISARHPLVVTDSEYKQQNTGPALSLLGSAGRA